MEIKGVSYRSVRLGRTAGSDSVSLGWKSFSFSKQISNAGSTFEIQRFKAVPNFAPYLTAVISVVVGDSISRSDDVMLCAKKAAV